MKAIAYDRFGPVAVMKRVELPNPVVGKGQVLVQVRASTINVLDSHIRNGQMGILVNRRFPKIPGIDISGVIVSAGEGVQHLNAGDRVFGAADPFRGGAFAEYIAVPANQLAPIPRNLSFEEAATIPVAALAALVSLRDLGEIKAGDNVLIHGASGGLGLFAIQIGKHLGARITGVAGTSAMEVMLKFGADTVIDYKSQAGAEYGRNYGLIINASGKLPFATAAKLLRRDGRLVEPSPTIPMVLGSRVANLFRNKKHLALMIRPARADLEILAEMAEKAVLKPTIARIYPLDQADAAFLAMEKGGVIGKIVVKI